MSIEANKAVIRRYKKGFLNSRDLAAPGRDRHGAIEGYLDAGSRGGDWAARRSLD